MATINNGCVVANNSLRAADNVHRTSTRLQTPAVGRPLQLISIIADCRSFVGTNEQPSAIVSWPDVHGKEGVAGSSPAEGFILALQRGLRGSGSCG